MLATKLNFFPKIEKNVCIYKIHGAPHTTLLDETSWPLYLNIKVQKPQIDFKVFICSCFGYLKKYQRDMNLEERRNLDGATYVTILSNLWDNKCLVIVRAILITY